MSYLAPETNQATINSYMGFGESAGSWYKFDCAVIDSPDKVEP